MLDWKQAEQKLYLLLSEQSKLDFYFVGSVIVPLLMRFRRGDRRLRLYNEIMSIDIPHHSLNTNKLASEPEVNRSGDPSTGSEQTLVA